MKCFLDLKKDGQESLDSCERRATEINSCLIYLCWEAAFDTSAFCIKRLNNSIAMVTCPPSKFLAFAVPIGIYTEEEYALK